MAVRGGGGGEKSRGEGVRVLVSDSESGIYVVSP